MCIRDRAPRLVPRPGSIKSPSIAPASSARPSVAPPSIVPASVTRPKAAVAAPARALAEPELLADDDILEEVSTAPRTRSLPPPVRDPLERLREAVGELEYLATPWQAAGVCAAALMRVLGARAVIVHTYDRKACELRAIAVESLAPTELLGAITDVSDDADLVRVVATGKASSVRFDGPTPRAVPDRLSAVAPKHGAVSAPAMAPEGCVALIEVVDGGGRVADACAYAAGQLARFLSGGSGIRRIG